MRAQYVLFIALGLCLATGRAHALELRLGLKGGLTLSGMIGVEAADPSIDLPPWHDSSIGAGGGGGLYSELHFNRLLALELDVLIESNRLYFESYGSDGSYLEQAVIYEQLRLPLLFKLTGHPGKHVELTGALGPEFMFGLGATPYSAIYPPRAQDMYYGANEQFGLAMAVAFGIGFTTKYLHIPLEVRFAYNMLGAYSYRDRVEAFSDQIYVLQAVENFQIAVMIGFGFRIPPEEPPKKPKPVVKPVEIDDPFYYPEPPEGAPPRVRRPW